EQVKAIGFAAWLERQLDPDRIDDAVTEGALAALPTLAMSIGDLQREYPRPDAETRRKLAGGEMTRDERRELRTAKRPFQIVGELQAAKMLRAVTSERQLQEVMVDFWFNHFNVFAGKGEVRWYLTAYERDVIRPHALGRFPDLLRATAHHPAMLFYLDNWLSTRPGFTVRAGPNAGRRAGLNENYGRELLELHTLGVDGGYTQTDVTEVARAFTGWTIEQPRRGGGFRFAPALHDDGEKVVLGHRIKAGGGERDGEDVLDIVASHASARPGDAATGNAALPVPAANRIPGQCGHVGQHGCTRESHERRARAHERPHTGRHRAGHDGPGRARRWRGVGHHAGDNRQGAE